MAEVTLSGAGAIYPPLPLGFPTNGGFSSSVIDATGKKFAMSGRVWFPARTGTKNISRVQFLFGTVTKAGGSALTVSLQDVSLVTAPPMQPDGVQDQTVAISNADANFATGVWYRTNTFSASRTVSCGDLLSVVIEFDGAGRLGADAVNFSQLNLTGALCQTANALYSGTAWALVTTIPTVVLEFDDGTYGIFRSGSPISATPQVFPTLNTTPDEYAAVINLPFNAKIDGIWALINTGSTADWEFIIYDGTTVLQTVVVSSSAIAAISNGRVNFAPIPVTSLIANNDYFISARPTTTNTIVPILMEVKIAAFFDLLDGGQIYQLATRTNLGAWTKTPTRRLLAGINLITIDSGGGGSTTNIYPIFD